MPRWITSQLAWCLDQVTLVFGNISCALGFVRFRSLVRFGCTPTWVIMQLPSWTLCLRCAANITTEVAIEVAIRSFGPQPALCGFHTCALSRHTCAINTCAMGSYSAMSMAHARTAMRLV